MCDQEISVYISKPFLFATNPHNPVRFFYAERVLYDLISQSSSLSGITWRIRKKTDTD